MKISKNRNKNKTQFKWWAWNFQRLLEGNFLFPIISFPKFSKNFKKIINLTFLNMQISFLKSKIMFVLV